LVDWSDVREQLRYMTLRASISVPSLCMSKPLNMATITRLVPINAFSIRSKGYCLTAAIPSWSPMLALEILGSDKWHKKLVLVRPRAWRGLDLNPSAPVAIQ
jgi:transposase, IS4 family